MHQTCDACLKHQYFYKYVSIISSIKVRFMFGFYRYFNVLMYRNQFHQNHLAQKMLSGVTLCTATKVSNNSTLFYTAGCCPGHRTAADAQQPQLFLFALLFLQTIRNTTAFVLFYDSLAVQNHAMLCKTGAAVLRRPPVR